MAVYQRCQIIVIVALRFGANVEGIFLWFSWCKFQIGQLFTISFT
jgi:hypothetical protein